MQVKVTIRSMGRTLMEGTLKINEAFYKETPGQLEQDTFDMEQAINSASLKLRAHLSVIDENKTK